jgi:hypothetical protein
MYKTRLIHTYTHTYIHAYIITRIRIYAVQHTCSYIYMLILKKNHICILKVMLKRGEDWVLKLKPGGDNVREGLPWNQAQILKE